MRLTNELRDQFVDAVMRNTKLKSKWDKDKILAEINKRLLATWPEEVHEFDRLYPGLIGRGSICINWIRYQTGNNWTNYAYANCYQGTKLESIMCDDLKKRWEEHQKEAEARNELRAKLREVAGSATTDTALAALFPELVKFIPKESPKVVKQLPVSNKTLVAELKKIGLEVGDD